MFGYQSLRLFLNALHTPALAGIRILVTSHDGNIIAGDIHIGQIIDNLLFISSRRIINGLRDARCQDRLGAGENGVVGVFHLFSIIAGIALQPVPCQFKQIVRKCIAASRTQIRQFADATLCLQHLNANIGSICTQNGSTHIFLAFQPLKTLVKEVGCAIRVGQTGSKVCRHNDAELRSCLCHVVQVKSIHVTIEVIHAKCVIRIDTKTVHTDVIRYLLNGACRYITELVTIQQQVTQVTCPTTQVRRCLIANIGNVQCAKHMAKVYLIVIGQLEIVDNNIPQVHGIGTLGSILLFHILGEFLNFLAGQGFPVVVIITINAGTDEVDHQQVGFLAGSGGISIRIAFQHLQSTYKFLIRRNATCGKSAQGQHSNDHDSRQHK